MRRTMTVKKRRERRLESIENRKLREEKALQAWWELEISRCPYKERLNLDFWVYYPDASGGNDSCFECQWCGCEFSKSHP